MTLVGSGLRIHCHKYDALIWRYFSRYTRESLTLSERSVVLVDVNGPQGAIQYQYQSLVDRHEEVIAALYDLTHPFLSS